MDKWDALREILETDAQAFTEQGESFMVRSKLVLDENERNQLLAGANILALQVAACSHYLDVMQTLDDHEKMLADSEVKLEANGGEPEPNTVEAIAEG